MMKIVLKNVGVIKHELELEPRALTIFTGGNNTGKTYAMYVLWAIMAAGVWPEFSFAKDLMSKINAAGSVQIPLDEFCRDYWPAIEEGFSTTLLTGLPDLFGTTPKFFQSAQIKVHLDTAALVKFVDKNRDYNWRTPFGGAASFDVRFTDGLAGLAIAFTVINCAEVPDDVLATVLATEISSLILVAHSARAILLPAERGGLNLFYDDLQVRRNFSVEASGNREIPHDQRDFVATQHAAPLKRYIQFLKDAKHRSRSHGGFHDQAIALQRDIAKVEFKVSDEGVITAKPDDSGEELGIHLTSSTVKNLYGLWAWLESEAKPGACLMIDEPELNLHPDNQRLVARLLVRLVNRGIRVVISTHSDYIVREMNSMIMLSSEFPERAAMEQQFGYDPAGSERLRADDVVAYHFTEQGVSQCKISPEFGIEVQSMDDAINRLNQSNSAIYYALSEKLHPMVETAELAEEGALNAAVD